MMSNDGNANRFLMLQNVATGQSQGTMHDRCTKTSTAAHALPLLRNVLDAVTLTKIWLS